MGLFFINVFFKDVKRVILVLDIDGCIDRTIFILVFWDS